jgi:LPS sulfotransferase NodH
LIDVTLTYLVCATPRSGSTLLCESLKATGRAGRPEEYFQAVPTTGIPRALEADDAAWERFFAAGGLPVLEIGFAELVRDLHGTLDRALDHIGVPHARRDLGCTPPTRRQSDGLSDAWVAAYEREAVEAPA